MLPEGRIFGRVFHPDLRTEAIAKVSIVSDSISIWNYSSGASSEIKIGKRTAQAFGEGTFDKLKQLKIGVVGVQVLEAQ
ncbi:MAG: hypothetical protein U5K54_15420 [Cytophagales bacterium]|nr:hypothetical protein [Cytophagales bacterium]